MKINSEKIKKHIRFATFFYVFFSFGILPFFAHSQVESLVDVPEFGDFVVGPAKVEVSLNPGESASSSISVLNRTGRTQRFVFSVEDFQASAEEDSNVLLLGEEKSSKSFKDFVSLSQSEVILSHGQRVSVPIVLSSTSDMEPGGRFVSVVVSMTTDSLEAGDGNISTGTSVIARIATLIFVTIDGDVVREGKLVSFETRNKQKFFVNSMVPFRLSFVNDGTVHLNPYGLVVVKNSFGGVVETIELDPWFTLPDSTRIRDVVFEKQNLFGRYTAIAQINRGYDDNVDEISVSFFVIPVREVVLVIIALAVLFFVIRKRNPKNPQS